MASDLKTRLALEQLLKKPEAKPIKSILEKEIEKENTYKNGKLQDLYQYASYFTMHFYTSAYNVAVERKLPAKSANIARRYGIKDAESKDHQLSLKYLQSSPVI